tara:strand:- start:1606 stop:2394 length:789 start_codon:yes stop_codon:yes gene_type:complete
MANINKINGVAHANISKINTHALSSGDKVIGAEKSTSATSLVLYNFNNQTTNENGSSDWNPSSGATGVSHAGWETDTACVTGGGSWGNPAGNSNTQTDGWNLGYGATGSTGTGPLGGVHDNLDGSYNASTRYMYVEGTGVKDDRVCVARTPGINYSTTMSNTALNLNLKYWLHQYSSNNSGHNLYIYIDDSSTSTASSATLLSTITDFSAFTANSSDWVQQTVSLNSYRTTDSTFYIYFVADGATSFRCDIAIDNVEFSEGG